MDDKTTIEISTATIIKAFLILGIVWIALILKDIIVLVLISFILATALVPVVERIKNRGIPRVLAVLFVYAIAGFAVYLLFRAIVPTVAEQINLVSQNKQYYIDRINELFNQSPDGVKTAVQDFLNEFPKRLREISVSGLLSGALGIFSGLLGFLTVVVLTFYFLLDKDGIEKILVHYMPEDYQKRGIRVFRKISRNMSLWFRGQIILSFTIGLISYIGLLVIGVDFALTLGVFAAFTELIPVIGPIIGGIPAVLVALSDSPTKALYVLVLYAVVQFVEGHFLVPQIMKKALGLSPVFIIISILIGARLFGILGVLLAVPVASALSVVVEEIHEYEKIEEEERSSKS